jgi:Glyoxalase/Bleomycin resistance protein/Dioxygenase superfamily
VLRGIEAVDRQLEAVVSPEQVGALRSALSVLAGIKQADIATGAGRARPAGLLRRFYPIFPVSDLRAALAHYRTLGFKTFAYEEGADYGFANRDGVGLHLEAHAGHARHRPASAYLNVRDAAALYEEWSRPGVAGHTHPAEPTPWGMLEGSHTDPDGNLIRFGSPIKELTRVATGPAGPARRSPRRSRGDPGRLRRRDHGRPAPPGAQGRRHGAAARRHKRTGQDRSHRRRAGGIPGDRQRCARRQAAALLRRRSRLPVPGLCGVPSRRSALPQLSGAASL